MGQKVVVFDDLDGSEGAETVTFSVAGTTYEVDLSEGNRAAMLDAFNPWIAIARPRRGAFSSGTSRVRSGKRSGGNPQLDAIRLWAGENGMRVSDKGRIPAEVRDAYNAAQDALVKVEPKVVAKAAPKPAEKPAEEPAFSSAGK